MSIYIGNDLEDRLEALEASERENELAKKCDLEDRLKAIQVGNASLKKHNEYHQLVHEINHMSALGSRQ